MYVAMSVVYKICIRHTIRFNFKFYFYDKFDNKLNKFDNI